MFLSIDRSNKNRNKKKTELESLGLRRRKKNIGTKERNDEDDLENIVKILKTTAVKMSFNYPTINGNGLPAMCK